MAWSSSLAPDWSLFAQRLKSWAEPMKSPCRDFIQNNQNHRKYPVAELSQGSLPRQPTGLAVGHYIPLL